MTQVSELTNTTTKAPQLLFNKCIATQVWQMMMTLSILHPLNMTANNTTQHSLLLPLNPAIRTANLLLLSIQERSAIMTATNIGYSLQLIVESISMGAQQVLQPPFELQWLFQVDWCIGFWRALFSTNMFEYTFNYAANKLNHGGSWALQATSLQTSKLNVIYSKISLHFHKDWGIFWGRMGEIVVTSVAICTLSWCQ